MPKRVPLVGLAILASMTLGACGAEEPSAEVASDSAAADAAATTSPSPTLPSDPPQSAAPGEIMYAANETLVIDHVGRYEWHSDSLPGLSGPPSSILFEYRFNGDVQTTEETAVPETLKDGSSDMIFTFNVKSYTGSPVLQIIKAAVAEPSGSTETP